LKQFIYIILLSASLTDAYSQGVFKGTYWKQYRRELTFGIGPSNFLGELGGKDQVGTDFAQDLEMKSTKYCLNVGYRYYFRSDMSVRGSLYYGVVSGDDKLTDEPYRNNRNIHFRAPIIEGSALVEYHVLREKANSSFKLKGSKGGGGSRFNVFGFAGIGFFYFNPQAKYIDGKWYDLQPLGTEGQGIGTNVSKYSKLGLCIPYGLSVRYLINSKWRIGLEAGVRKTFSDYIDDVSTVYADPTVVNASYGPVAAYFSNPAKSKDFDDDKVSETSPGLQRGDPDDKDTYIFTSISLSYKLIKQRSFKKIRSRRSVPSF
jgi:hypothetical protein